MSQQWHRRRILVERHSYTHKYHCQGWKKEHVQVRVLQLNAKTQKMTKPTIKATKTSAEESLISSIIKISIWADVFVLHVNVTNECRI